MASAPAPSLIRNGDHAVLLLRRSCDRLVALQDAVVADRDPEDLHRLRVALRRLRSVVGQFGPALQLPAGVADRPIARVARRLGRARDLDVLCHQLERELLPQLAGRERRRLATLVRRLRRERRLARAQLRRGLHSGSYRRLLAGLQRWLRRPAFTPLGDQPLADWLIQWQLSAPGAVLLHPGWWVLDRHAGAEQLHDLRKCCKQVRYSLENLAEPAGAAVGAWAVRFEAVQERLGSLNDLEVLQRALECHLGHGLHSELPGLAALLQQRAEAGWLAWRPEAQAWLEPATRLRLCHDLATTGS
jgi:CHAD domain-containing protein